MKIELTRQDAESILQALRLRIVWGVNEAKRRNPTAAKEIEEALHIWREIITMILHQAKEQGCTLNGTLAGMDVEVDEFDRSDRGDSPMEFTESDKGYEARDKWAERYDELNGAPESDDDR